MLKASSGSFGHWNMKAYCTCAEREGRREGGRKRQRERRREGGGRREREEKIIIRTSGTVRQHNSPKT